MRLSLLTIVLLICGYVIVLGLQPGALPFIPQAEMSDSATSHWPAALHLQRSIRLGHGFPIWQDIVLGGQPFAANPLNKTAYPLQWLAVVLPPALHINLMVMLHLLLAGWGMLLWARQQGLAKWPALFSAVSYMLTPKLLAHLGAGHIDLLYALAWWPWLMWAIRPAVRSGRWRDAVPVSVFAALVLLSDVRMALFALSVAGIYALIEMRRYGWQALRLAALAGPLFLLLVASVLVPLLGWRPFLNRGTLSAADAGIFSLEGVHLLGLFLPPQSGNWETTTYAGLVVLLLAMIALLKMPRQHVMWWGMLLFFGWYALGSNGLLWSGLVRLLPPLLWFRVPSRAWFVVALGISLLAGHGLQMLMDFAEHLRQGGVAHHVKRWRLAAVGWLVSFTIAGIAVLVIGLPWTMAVNLLMAGLLGGGVLLLAGYGRLTPSQIAVGLLVISALDLMWMGAQWLTWRGPDTWLTHQQGVIDTLKADNVARVFSPDYGLEQQVAIMAQIPLLYGVDPFQLSGIVDAVQAASGMPNAAYSVIQPALIFDDESVYTLSAPDTDILALWGVSHVVTKAPLAVEQLSLLAEVDDVFVYRNDNYAAQPAVGWPAWSGLPDAQTVAMLNRLTVGAAIMSAMTLFVSLIFWRITRL